MPSLPFAPHSPQPALSSASWIHAHCDGGSRGNPGPSGFGALITDAQGNVLAELSEFLGTRTNNYAEYAGLLAVIQWAIENGHPRLKVVSDSELMVKQIQGKYKVNSPDLKPLWQTARDRIARLQGFEISHALRHKNKEADALANQAMDRGMGRGGGGATVESLPLRRAVVVGATGKADSSAALRNDKKLGGANQDLLGGDKPSLGVRPAKPSQSPMLRGFTRGGAIHLLGGASLPDGIFVKVIRE